jgi:hypothetical protein
MGFRGGQYHASGCAMSVFGSLENKVLREHQQMMISIFKKVEALQGKSGRPANTFIAYGSYA